MYEESGDYLVNATVDDLQLHSDPEIRYKAYEIAVVDSDTGTSFALIAGVAILALVALALVAYLLARRKKGGSGEVGDTDSMEGMAPSDDGPPA